MRPTDARSLPPPPTWVHPREWPGCVRYPRHLRRTALTAVLVGTTLFLVNHLAVVLANRATLATWLGTGASFVVPFCVANVGVLIASCRRELAGAAGAVGVGRRTWSRPGEAPRYLLTGRNLRRTALTALVVGSLYLLVNQLPALLAGDPATRVWVAIGVDYLAPFCVSNTGVLVTGHRSAGVAPFARDGADPVTFAARTPAALRGRRAPPC